MYSLVWHITIGEYRLKTLKSVKISASVLNLSDTARIELPAQYLNTWQKIEDKIKTGDEVCIDLGYGNSVKTEFKGFLKRISRDNNTLVLECEDALYLLNVAVADKEYKEVTLNSLIGDILSQVDGTLIVVCDYNYIFKKFVVFHQTALDIIKKIHEETKANIWFEDKTLHIHPVYTEKRDEEAIIFDTAVNVLSNALKWVTAGDKKVQIEVVLKQADGAIKKKAYGDTGGSKVTKIINGSSETDMQTAAENEYNLWNYDGFEGNFTAWLIPRVIAGTSVRLRDTGKPEGKYYVTGIDIEFGSSGAKRKITLGRKLS
ncbi:MAG: hypothetical protein RRY55_01305 [Bacteroidales bacterium]